MAARGSNNGRAEGGNSTRRGGGGGAAAGAGRGHSQTPAESGQTTLFVRDLHEDATESDLQQVFNIVVSGLTTAVPRDKTTGKCRGFGFLNFESVEDARYVMQAKNNTSIRGKTCQLKWNDKTTKSVNNMNENAVPETGSSNGGTSTIPADNRNASLFVGDLDPEVTESDLLNVFNVVASGLNTAVPRDKNAGKGRGYGFLNFESVEDARHVLETMQNAPVRGRPCQLKWDKKETKVANCETNVNDDYVHPNAPLPEGSPDDSLQEIDGILQTSVMGATATSVEYEDAADIFDRIKVFHDAENCTVPHHAYADGSKLFDAVLREALELGTNKVLSDETVIPGRARVFWQLVQNEDSKNGMTVHPQVLNHLISREVRVLRPLTKKGSADISLFGLLDEELEYLNEISVEKQRRTLEVVLTADVDFKHQIIKLTKTHATVVLIHCGNCKAALNDIVKRGRQKHANPTWQYLVRSVSNNNRGKNWPWESKSARTNSVQREPVSAPSNQEWDVCYEHVVHKSLQHYVYKIEWNWLLHQIKQINQKLYIRYELSEIDPTVALFRLWIIAEAGQEERQRSIEEVEKFLENMISNLISISLTINAPKSECISKEMRKMARSKSAMIWSPGTGESADPFAESSVLIQVPIFWTKDQVLEQAQKMAIVDGITVSDVIGPYNAEKRLAESRGSSSVFWRVSLPSNADPTAPVTLIGQDPEIINGVSVQFEGDSYFQFENQEASLVVAVTHKGNERALEEIKQEYYNLFGGELICTEM